MSTRINTHTWIMSIILAISTLALVACSGPDDKQMLQTAKNYLSEQKIRKAALELRDALQKNPDNGEARYLLGQINIDIDDNAAAEKEFRRASKAGWQEEDAQIGLSRALINTHKFQDLMDDIEIKETYSDAARANLYGLRAAAQAGLGKVDQAIETLATGAKIDANAFQLLKSTIQLRLVKRDLEGASSTLKQALSVHPDNPELLLLSAITAVQNENQVGATEAYQKVIDQYPPKLFTVYGRKARLGLTRLQILEQKFDQAQSTLAPLVEMKTSEPDTNFLAGWLAFAQGNYQTAEDHLFKVLKVAPEHAPTHFLFGIVNYSQKDYEQAAYYIAKYVNVVPDNLPARKLLGRTYMTLGQQDEAQATLQTALKEEGAEDVELLALMGLSQLQSGDTDSGIKGLKHALKVNPERATLRSELAKAYISTGETDHAIQELKTILAQDGGKQQTETLLVIAYLRAGNFDQAINAVLEMLSKNPEDPAVLTLAGNVFSASDDKPEARKYFSKALQLKPGHFKAAMSLAGLEELQSHYAKAAVLYKSIVDTNTESIAPLLALARLAELQANKKDMLDWLEQARKQAPRDIKPRVMLTEYYLREKQNKKADSLVKEALKTGSQEPILLALQSRVLMADNRYNGALPILKKLVTREPDSILARTLLSETYLNLKQEKDARKQLKVILKKQQYYVPALVLMARVELQAENYEQVLEYTKQIQKTRPDLYISYEFAGDAQRARKQYVEAKTAYTQAWNLEPSATLAIKISEALKRSGKPEEAPAALLAWLKNHPDDARPLQFLGTSYQDIGQNDKAIQSYEKVLAVQSDNAIALNNLAWLYSLSNNPKGLKLAEKAYQAYPDNTGIQDTYGWLLVQQGQADKGRRLLKQVMEKLPEVSEVRYHYAVALLKSGEKAEAHKRLKQLLQSKGSFEGKKNIKVLLGG